MTLPPIVSPGRTFLDQPLTSLDAVASGDIAILGAPEGTPYPARGEVGYELTTKSADAPQAIRDSANETSSNIDHYDYDLGGTLLGDGKRRLVDCGDLLLNATDGPGNRDAIQTATRAVLEKGGIPFLLGGDDSVPIPFLRAFGGSQPIDILQIDAHIDWRESIAGVQDGYSSTMRRASELPFVRSITQIGMRGVGSARQSEVDAALEWGATILPMARTRALGPDGIVGEIPVGGQLVIQIDCDAFDPSVCPAVNAPTPGGFHFDELAAIIRAVVAAHQLAGFSIVELVPCEDHNTISAIAAARIVCNAIGALARCPA